MEAPKKLWHDYPRVSGALATVLAIVLCAIPVSLRPTIEQTFTTAPGHTHMGLAMRLDCNGCGQVLAGFVRGQIAQVASETRGATRDAVTTREPK